MRTYTFHRLSCHGKGSTKTESEKKTSFEYPTSPGHAFQLPFPPWVSFAFPDSFDLLFIMVDECNIKRDRLIAEHIAAMHQGRVAKPYFHPDQV